jgi:glycosyltransferase involved in cell wall biosynthesis
MKKFSVLIAYYNNYDFFLDCYQSLLRQTYKNFEAVILDDYSTDGSFERLLELVKDDYRFRVFQNNGNRGVGFTKKRLVEELSSGDICGFLDPDDALEDNAIEESVKNYNNEKIIATYSYIKICDEKMNFGKIFPNTRSVRQSNSLFFNIDFEISHFFTFRKSAYGKIRGINPDLKIAEDIDLYLQLYDVGNIRLIPQPLYLYRIHNNGLSHSPEKENLKKESWNSVLKETIMRRNITHIYGKPVSEISDLPSFIYKKETISWLSTFCMENYTT